MLGVLGVLGVEKRSLGTGLGDEAENGSLGPDGFGDLGAGGTANGSRSGGAGVVVRGELGAAGVV